MNQSGNVGDQGLKQIYAQVHQALNFEEQIKSGRSVDAEALMEALQYYGKAIQMIGVFFQSKDAVKSIASSNQIDRLKMIYEKCTERTISLLNDCGKSVTTSSQLSSPPTTRKKPLIDMFSRVNPFGSSELQHSQPSNLLPQDDSIPPQQSIERLNEMFNITKAKLLKLDQELQEVVKIMGDPSQTQKSDTYLKIRRKFQEKSRMKEQVEKELLEIDQQRAFYYNKEVEHSQQSFSSSKPQASTKSYTSQVLSNLLSNIVDDYYHVDASSTNSEDINSYTDVKPKMMLENDGFDLSWLQFIRDNYSHNLPQEAQLDEENFLRQVSILPENDLYYFVLGYVMNIRNHPLSGLFDAFSQKFKDDFVLSIPNDKYDSQMTDFAVMSVKDFCSNITQYLLETDWKESNTLKQHKLMVYSVMCQTIVTKIEFYLQFLYRRKEEAVLVEKKLNEGKNISLLDLGVDTELCLEGEYQPAISKLREIERTSILSEKVTVCRNVYSLVRDVAKRYTSIEDRDMDQKLIPVLVYIFIKAHVVTIYSQFDIMIDFSTDVDNRNIFESDWECISTFKSALLELSALSQSGEYAQHSLDEGWNTLDADIEQEFERLSSDSFGSQNTSPSNMGVSTTAPEKNKLLDRLNKLLAK